MDNLLSVPEFGIYQIVHSYAKIYPNTTKLFVYDTPTKVRVPGFEAREKIDRPRRKASDNPMIWLDSLRRTKTRLSDIVVSNDFDLFCTFTFAKDRQNVDHLKSQMSKWLNNQSMIHGRFAYLIVPEFHKDGKSIHFHALFKGYNGNLVDSGHKTKAGQVIYNISSYRLGFSTAVKIENIDKVGSYVKKYITKDMPQFNNKRRYWCSHDLTRPKKVTNPVVFPYEKEHFTEQYAMKNLTVHTAHKRLDLISEQSKGKLLQ